MEIQFQAKTIKAGLWTLVVLPADVSGQLPSRGMCMIEGEIDGAPFQAPLEPDGRGSHWFRLPDSQGPAGKVQAGVSLALTIQLLDSWPDPKLPSDIEKALDDDALALAAWADITPKARWDWLRWIRSTSNPQTRCARIEKARSMLSAGKRRPCCFDRNRCTEPEISSNGVLKY